MDIVPYDGNHQKALLNATQAESAYDIIAMDVLWAGEFGASQVYAPLNDYVARYDVEHAGLAGRVDQILHPR